MHVHGQKQALFGQAQQYPRIVSWVRLSNQSGVGWQGLNLGAVGAETDRRGFIPVNEKMQVLGKDGKVVPHVYCIGDANGARPVMSCTGLVRTPELNMDLQSAEMC